MHTNTSDKLLTTGDVFKADDSYVISGFVKNNHRVLSIGQNFNYASLKPGDGIPSMNGSFAANVRYASTGQTLSEILLSEGINVRGKKFLVVYTNTQGGGYSAGDRSRTPYSDGHHVTAIELTEKSEILKGGLTVEFYQSGSIRDENKIANPKVVGRMEPTFMPFKPV